MPDASELQRSSARLVVILTLPAAGLARLVDTPFFAPARAAAPPHR